MFNLKKPILLKKKLKRRCNSKFSLFYKSPLSCSLIAIRGINLLYYNLSFLNFILNKKKTKKKKMSRKEKFKRGASALKLNSLRINKTELNKFGNKNIFSYLNIKEKKRIKVHFLKKTRLFKKKIIVINLPLTPYTKKTVGLRMGKGKGPVKNFQYKIKPGMTIVFFKNWGLGSLSNILYTIKKKLPHAFRVNLPKIKINGGINKNFVWNY